MRDTPCVHLKNKNETETISRQLCKTQLQKIQSADSVCNNLPAILDARGGFQFLGYENGQFLDVTCWPMSRKWLLR